MNISAIKSTVIDGVNNVGANAYANTRVIANRVKAGDAFKPKYAEKIIDKARQDFAANKNIKVKTFAALGAAALVVAAAVKGIINKITPDKAEKAE